MTDIAGIHDESGDISLTGVGRKVMTIEILELFADYSSEGSPVREEVRAKPLGGLVFEILQSPGLVLGIAAGDVTELGGDDHSRFHVKKRGGNICIKIYCAAVSDRMAQEFEKALSGGGGWLDGRLRKSSSFPFLFHVASLD